MSIGYYDKSREPVKKIEYASVLLRVFAYIIDLIINVIVFVLLSLIITLTVYNGKFYTV